MTTRRQVVLAVAILALATALRAWDLGRLSFWYDEVVSVRLARAGGPAELLRLLGRIDATRAPLHPLLLQAWLATFGPSAAAARAFSVACGVLTVALIGRLGRRFFHDTDTGLWAAALAAVSPLLVVYSREARMYAALVAITCAAWDALLALREPGGPTHGRLAWYGATLVALGYAHPLGLLMAATLGLACLACRRELRLTWTAALAPHVAAATALGPWVVRYVDHAPESTVGRLPLKFLLGLPIGFLGGNFVTLAGFVALAVYGSLRGESPGDTGRRTRPGLRLDDPLAVTFLWLWLTLPPLTLYAYSRLSHPIFGPARYTLYVAPAFLILVARGLARLPRWPRWGLALATLGLALASLPSLVFAPDLKADWRAAASRINRDDPGATETVVVLSTDPDHNVEVETARYYLGPDRPILPMNRNLDDLRRLLPPGAGRVWFAVGVRGGKPAAALPMPVRDVGETVDLPGLRLTRVELGRL